MASSTSLKKEKGSLIHLIIDVVVDTFKTLQYGIDFFKYKLQLV